MIIFVCFGLLLGFITFSWVVNPGNSGEHLERVGRALIFKPEYKERILRIWEDTPSTPSAVVLRSSVIPFPFAVFSFSPLEKIFGFWRWNFVLTFRWCCLAFFVCFNILLRVLIDRIKESLTVYYVYADSLLAEAFCFYADSRESEPKLISTAVKPGKDRALGWTTVVEDYSDGNRIIRHLHPISTSLPSKPENCSAGPIKRPWELDEKPEIQKKKPKNVSSNENDEGNSKGGGTPPDIGPSSGPSGNSESGDNNVSKKAKFIVIVGLILEWISESISNFFLTYFSILLQTFLSFNL